MADYSYTRALANGAYNINNISHTDGGASPVTIVDQIKAEGTLPDEFNMICEGTACAITFNPALSGAQETTLDGIVAAQKVDN